MRSILNTSIYIVTLLTLAGSMPAQTITAAIETFGGGYASLHPQQKRLVDDWFQRFSATIGKPVNPEEGYNNLPLSAKTTFGAVTHALLRTRLTNATGETVSESAIELVDKVDNVAGEIRGARGDEQYRIYVQMKPDAMERLAQSREFQRSVDNMVYHRGYPVCFRSAGAAPSIQISLTRDATRADVDVDYRSSKFPVMLFNGHLTASNSDVRAKDNDERHNRQWIGLQNWWRNLLGLPVLGSADATKVEGQVVAEAPRLKSAKAADAVYDFLSAWLVEQKPNDAIGYLASEAYACMEIEREARIDRGMAKFEMLRAMQSADRAVGKLGSLGEAVSAVTLSGGRVKTIKQPHTEFTLYDVREDLAEEFKCTNQLDSTQIPAKAQRSESFGKYAGAVFRLNQKDGRSTIIASLWQNRDGYWRLISYEVDPQVDRSSVPNLNPSRPATPEMQYVDGDKEMIQAASDFLKQWLVKKDFEKATSWMAPESLACVNLYRADDAPEAKTPQDSLSLLKDGMSKIASVVGQAKNLQNAINAPPLDHPDLKLVKHAESRSFAIASIPEYMAEAAACDRRKPDGEPNFSRAPASGYGKHYASGFELNLGKVGPAVLWIVWGKKANSWKVLSYLVLVP